MTGAAPHPEMQAILLAMQEAAAPALETLPIGEARDTFTQNNRAWNEPLPPVRASEATLGGVSCRVLEPAARRGVVLFVHGGGWTFGSPATHERFARLLAETARALIVAPDYRLAPEHPAPAAIEDVLAVLADLGRVAAPQERVVLCGDSAGANIALGVALERPARAIAMLSLLYGCFAPVFDTASHARNGDGRFGLSTERMRWYWRNWLGSQPDQRAAPLHADLGSLPRTHLIAAGLDPLCDDSLMLADRLLRHGVAARLDLVPGVVHGFLQMTSKLAPAREATRLIAAEIAAALGGNDDGTNGGTT
jgi:acetyl esterase